MSPNLEYLEKSGSWKRPLENLELSRNLKKNRKSQGKLKSSKFAGIFIFARNVELSKSSKSEKHIKFIYFFHFDPKNTVNSAIL